MNKGFFDDVELNNVLKYEADLHEFMKDSSKYSKLLSDIETDQKLTEESEKKLNDAITEFKNSTK